MSKRVNLNAVKFDATDTQSGIRISDSIEKFRFTLDETPHDHMFGGVKNNPPNPANENHTSPLPGRGDLPFSISAWVNLAEAPLNKYNSICSKWGSAGIGSKEWLFAIARTQRSGVTRTRILFGLYDDPASTGTQNRFQSLYDFPLNQWVHIVATYGGNPDNNNNITDIVVYQDGAAILQGAGSGHYTCNEDYEAMPAHRDDNSPLTIGNVGPNVDMPFRGQLADICIFNKKLSQSEVTEVYNGGKVKDMSKFSDQSSLMAWWKMGDDIDTPAANGIKNYVEDAHHGTFSGISSIVPVPALPTDRIKMEDRVEKQIQMFTSLGRTAAAKNIAGDGQVFIQGGISGDMPNTDPDANTKGFDTEGQRYLHLYWKKEAADNVSITVFGFSNATGQWSILPDVSLFTANAAANTYRIFQIAGIDKVYFKQSGDAMASTDLFAAACSNMR